MPVMSVVKRKAVFAELVTLQDQVVPVEESRRQVCEKHQITEASLKRIEDLGIAKDWPPLD
jgi:hypothetical protein